MARVFVSLITVGAVLFGASIASAQESRPARPTTGLFAGGTEQYKEVLSVDGSLGTGYDTDVLMENQTGLPGLTDPRASAAGIFNQFAGGLSYTSTQERSAVGVSLSSIGRHYPQLDVSMTSSYAASAGASISLGRNKRTTLTGGADTSYQSVVGFFPFPAIGDPVLGQIVAVGHDYAGVRASNHRYSLNGDITRQLSRRASLTASYRRETTQFNSGQSDLQQQTGAIRFSRSLSRYLSLRLGYGFTDASYQSTSRDYQYHNIDTGVDYARDLSLTRRTKLSFSTGAAAVRQDQTTRVDVIGLATLNREIGRTWHALVTYQRNVGFMESVRAPFFYDGLNASLGGQITRRWSFRSGAGATFGNVGVTQSSAGSNGFDAWTGFSGVTAALTRHLALGFDYTFYRYQFEQGAALTTGLASRVNRHSVIVTANAWAPIFQHGRKSNAAR